MLFNNLELSKNIAFRISGALTIWSSLIKDKEEILRNCSYLIKPNLLFKKIKTTKERMVLHSDYYGGPGIGCNIGSGRTGNNEKYQIKGIGRTNLVGKSENIYNTSGAYPLYEGITETMMYNMWYDIFPVKIIKHFSLIYIGKSDYYLSSEKPKDYQMGLTPLCILVRERCIRVGNFLRCHNIPKNYSIKSDINRVSKNNRELLKSYIKNPKDIFLNFAKNCALQFSFCRVNRISHGALSPSNISITGNWLDLTNTTAVPDNFDTQAGLGDPTFLNEQNYISYIIKEWVKTFNKYNNINIDYNEILDFYYKELSNNFNNFVLNYFNIEQNIGEEKFVKNLSIAFNYRISKVEKYHRGVPREHYSDVKMLEFIDEIFISAISKPKSLVYKVYKNQFLKNEKYGKYENYLLSLSLKPLKITIFRKILHIGNAYIYARKIVNSKKVANLANYAIEESKSISKWIFNEENLIFKNRNLEIKIEAGKIKIIDVGKTVLIEVHKANEFIEKISDKKLTIYDINLKKNIIKILLHISIYKEHFTACKKEQQT